MIAALRGKGLRLEKRLVKTERMGVLMIENEWDFDVYATRLGVTQLGPQIRDLCVPKTQSVLIGGGIT